ALGEVEVGAGVDKDVVDPDTRLDDRHRGLGDDGLDELRPTPRDDEVHESAGGHERPGGVVPAAVEQAYRVLVDALSGKGFPHHAHERTVARCRGGPATEEDRVAALEARGRG